MNYELFQMTLKKEIGIVLKDEQVANFKIYASLLQKWNKVMDLTAIDETESIIEKHFFDSLLSAKYFSYDNQTVLDIGSGAGFPGLVLKIVFPNLKITLLEPTLKRCKFLQEVISKLNLKDIEVINDRAENYIKIARNKYDIVTSRAVSRLNILLELSIPYLNDKGVMIALKGKNADEEIRESQRALNVLKSKVKEKYYLRLPSEQENRCIILIVKTEGKIDNKYPRNYNLIKNKPL